MNESLLTRIMKEHDRLLLMGKMPDSLFLSESSRQQLIREALASLGVNIEYELWGMSVYPANQYKYGSFKIYCQPEF